MVSKSRRKKSSRKPVKTRVIREKVIVQKELPKGFFSRLKEILPSQSQEKVRVKTFIVDRPVIVEAPPQRIYAPKEKYGLRDEDYEKYDSGVSRYSRKREPEEDELEGVPVRRKGRINAPEEDFSNESDSVDELDSADDSELADEESLSGTDEFSEEANEIPSQNVPASHVRSHGMFLNVWWKKALLWAFLFWLGILALGLAMQAMKLIIVDLTRQWWILLAGLIVLMMIYFKFFEGKIRI